MRGPEPNPALIEVLVAEIGDIEREPSRMIKQIRAAKLLELLDRLAARLSHSNRT
jgi:hypothetical protein